MKQQTPVPPKLYQGGTRQAGDTALFLRPLGLRNDRADRLKIKVPHSAYLDILPPVTAGSPFEIRCPRPCY